jgi:transcription antitermination protein NusB
VSEVAARHRSREAAVQILYSMALAPNTAAPPAADLDRSIAEFWTHFSAPEGAREFADALVRGVVASVERLDARLERASIHWRLDRMGKIDLAILRLAAYELTEAVDVPREVAIDEALELAKTYSSEDAAKFINGVLAGIVQNA